MISVLCIYILLRFSVSQQLLKCRSFFSCCCLTFWLSSFPSYHSHSQTVGFGVEHRFMFSPSTIGTFIYWSFFVFVLLIIGFALYWPMVTWPQNMLTKNRQSSDSSKHWQLVMDIIYINKMFVCVARVVFYVVLMVSLRRYMKVYVFSTISLAVIVALSVLHYIFYVMHPNLEQQRKKSDTNIDRSTRRENDSFTSVCWMMWFWWWYESVLESNLYHFIVIDLGAPQKSVAFEWLNITTTHSNGFFSFVFNILFAFLNMSFENVFDRYEWTRMRVCSLCVVRSENQNIAVKNENQINNDSGREKYGAAADCSNFGCGHISAAPTPHATRSTVHANCRLHSTCKSISVHINRCRYWRRSVICTTFLPLIVVGAHMRGWLWHYTMLWCRTAHWTLPIFDSLHLVLRLLNSWCASMRWTWFVSPWFGRPCKKNPLLHHSIQTANLFILIFIVCYSSYYIFLFLFFFGVLFNNVADIGVKCILIDWL